MNTLKKIVATVLMATLLVCVAFAFASCSIPGLGGSGEKTHCPADCECREGETPSTPEHCPDDCECRVESSTPANVTYLVVVRDDQGNIVPDVTVRISDGAGFIDKVTAADGFVTFPLTQGTWKVQITEAPLGYQYDPATKYEFNAEGVCAVELVKPVGYTFVAKSAYDDTVFADVVVNLYNWDAENDMADYSEVVATGITDKDGKVTLEAVAGLYAVEFVVDDETKYIDSVKIEVPSDVYEVLVNDNFGSSINNPFFAEGDELWAYVPNGGIVWYSVMRANDRTITINNPDAFVVYNDETHYPDENGVIEVALVEDWSFNIRFGIGYASDAEDAPEYADVVANLIAPLGSKDNPIVLDNIGDLDIVNVGADEEDNAIWYVWTPTFEGRLFLLCDNANNVIEMNDGAYYTEAIEGASLVQIDFKPFVDVNIGVYATETVVEYVEIPMEDGSVFSYEQTTVNNVAAELDIDALVYAKYTAEFFDLFGEALAGETITVADAEGNTVSVVVTDKVGVAEVLLPVGTYTFSASAPAGYTVYPATLEEGDYNAFLSVSPYDFADYYNEAITMPGGTLEGYMFEIPAGETMNFMVRLNGTFDFTIIGNWDATVYYGRQQVSANRLGNIELRVTGNPMYPVEFSIVNQNTESATTILATLVPPAPGLIMDNPIVITENGTFTAPYDVENCTQGAVFYTYTATAAGVVKVVTESNVASITINNLTSGAYGDAFVADENTTEANPLTIQVEVAEGDVLMIIVGVNSYDIFFADVEFDFAFEEAVTE